MFTFKQYILEKIYYRGLKTQHNPSYNSHIQWYSESEDLAKDYAGTDKESHIITTDLPKEITEKSFKHGFRTAFTEVKAKDFLERIKRGINEAFENKWITKEQGLALFDEIDNLEIPNGYKRVFDWWNEYAPFSSILKKAGYKSIHNIERNINTYGVFS